jgi:hypothetical protein
MIPPSQFVLLLFLVTLTLESSNSFSIGNAEIKASILQRHSDEDATNLPSSFFGDLKLDTLGCKISLSSDFQEHEVEFLTPKIYCEYTKSRHLDCLDLFGRYDTKILRCEEIPTSAIHTEFNIRWEASWMSANSVWLFDLANAVGWEVEKRVPDPSKMSTFSWNRVGQVFLKAFETGTIYLPEMVVQGTSRLKISQSKEKIQVSLTESIDLVKEADLSRLQNRIVAQEFASWLDVSRRPYQLEEVLWASKVRKRILATVPFAGALDIDPNEEDGPDTVLGFAFVCIAAFGILYKVLLGELSESQGQVSALCEEAAKLEMGSGGYLTECFGAFGDGPFI